MNSEQNKSFEEVSKQIQANWTESAKGYSEQNNRELQSDKKEIWTEAILENVVKEGKLKVLDIGCGPGEFTILMALAGHDATGVDLTPAMLDQARNNAKKYNVEANFINMDVQNLQFEDETFDLIIARNVTWNLQDAESFFKGCHRVLKVGGRMVYFDANWYLYMYDEEVRREKEIADKKYEEIYKKESDHSIKNLRASNIAHMLSLSKENRPNWDRENLPEYGFKVIRIDENINERVLDEEG
ncbi:MAG: class I SAM-dependent methyltransferase, partial [Intestinibacter sp.]